MDRSTWINKLEALHHRLRAGEQLSRADARWYAESREALLRAALSEQSLRLSSSERLRRSLRGEISVGVVLEAPGWTRTGSTTDIGAGGFACLLDARPPAGARVTATLLIPDGRYVTEAVRVVSVSRRRDLSRVSFAFEASTPGTRDELEAHLLDGVLKQLTFWDDVLESIHVR
jgi:hypothetical protein